MTEYTLRCGHEATARTPAEASANHSCSTSRPRLSVVVDGQYGSCGKGAVAGWLSRPDNNPGQSVTVVRVGGPQAGHTVYGPCPARLGCDDCDIYGHPWRFRQIPVAAVTNPDALLVIAAGSEIDLAVLKNELDLLEQAGISLDRRLFVDTNATVLTDEHKYREGIVDLTGRIGSTGKGVGAARADRIMRTAQTIGQHCDNGKNDRWLHEYLHGDTAQVLMRQLGSGEHVVIEGTQGWGLGLHTPYYPQVTSTDCRAIDFLAQAGISPWAHPGLDLQVWMAVRPNPIRVAGNSGPMLGETSWEDLGLPPEKTTVTQKIRRVGAWDPDLFRQAVQANGGETVRVVLTMADHLDPAVEGVTHPDELTPEIREFIDMVQRDAGVWVWAVGTSPITICPRIGKIPPAGGGSGERSSSWE